MTTDEATVILSVITAAYPHAYKNMTDAEAKAVVTVWALQFADMPADIVFMAVNKAISTCKFPPTIAEVKDKISALYWEAYEALNTNQRITHLPDDKRKAYRRICDCTKDAKIKGTEPTLDDMLTSSAKYLLE